MSFDIFVQAFRDGDAHEPEPARIEHALAPYLDFKREHLVVGDATAELYLSAASFMVTHVDGFAIYDVLVEVAFACDLVIMSIGVPVALTREEQRPHLPEEIRAGAVVVHSGSELAELIRSS